MRLDIHTYGVSLSPEEKRLYNRDPGHLILEVSKKR